ncbi:MAG: hypothetical protein OXH27_01090, partial [Gammaproteobacteria bacterium]|nr:hypothetical protein [Gammaproteobacteria bacterium]
MNHLFKRFWPCLLPLMAVGSGNVFAQNNQLEEIQEIVITGATRTYSALGTTRSMPANRVDYINYRVVGQTGV